MVKESIAHIKGDGSIQTVEEHCKNTADYCAIFLKQIGFGKTGEIIGLLHDAGKLQNKFGIYIRKAYNGEKVTPGIVVHTTTGVMFLWERYHYKDDASKLVAEMMAYAIGAHHGSFDCMNLNEESGFEKKLQRDKSDIEYDSSMEYFFEHIKNKKEMDALFGAAVQEYQQCAPKLTKRIHYSFLVRMLTSALIHADRRDTQEFMEGIEHCEAVWDEAACRQYWEENLVYAEGKINAFTNDTSIQRVRKELSYMCREHAQWNPGVYLLDMPTGSGKTLAALRYSYAHAMYYKKKRVIFLTPLLSVLEQNAAEIRKYTYHKEDILEHHSNVIREGKSDDELDWLELAMEGWESRIIISTFVQFLQILFDGKTSSVRRMQALCDSVIVIDEVQSLPWKVTAMFNQAVDFLSQVCHATVVLCSATQPGLDGMSDKYRLHLTGRKRLVELSPEKKKVFKRTNIRDCTCDDGYTIDAMVDTIDEKMRTVSSVLVICNTKCTARALFQAVKKLGYKTLHLSTSMCMEHRRDAIKDLEKCLEQNSEKVICVSTQLFEAGIDVSFQYVIRFMAGLDNIIQSAGRCNRHGDYGTDCNVDIMNLQGEDVSRLKEIQERQNAMRSLLERYKRDTTVYQNDLSSDACVRDYYRKVYRHLEKQHTILYPVQIKGVPYYLYKLLSKMQDDTQILCQPFKSVGECFEVFDDHGVDILVPYKEEGKELIADFMSERAKHDIAFVAQLLERSKGYTIHIFEYELQKLCETGAAEKRVLGTSEIVCLKEAYYDEDGVGLDMEGRFDFMSM